MPERFVSRHGRLGQGIGLSQHPGGIVLLHRVLQPGVTGRVVSEDLDFGTLRAGQSLHFGERAFLGFAGRQAPVEVDGARARHGAQRRRQRADLGDRDGAFAQERVLAQAGVQLFHFLHEPAHFIDGIVAALGCAGVARLAAQVDFDLHAPAVPAINPQPARLGDHHAVRADAVLLEDVEPRQPVAILFLHRTHHVERVVAQQAELLDELAGIYHAGHAGALVAGAAPVDVAVFHFAAIRVPGPFLGIADAHRVGVRVHHDDVLAGTDAPEDVAHGVDEDFVESNLFHLLADTLDHRTFMAALGGDGDQVAQELHDVGFVGFGQGGEAGGIDCRRHVLSSVLMWGRLAACGGPQGGTPSTRLPASVRKPTGRLTIGRRLTTCPT